MVTHDAEIRIVEDERGARAVVARADDEIWISDDLIAAIRQARPPYDIAGGPELRGDVLAFGTPGEGLGRLTYQLGAAHGGYRVARRT